jgi:hypothetical protein
MSWQYHLNQNYDSIGTKAAADRWAMVAGTADERSAMNELYIRLAGLLGMIFKRPRFSWINEHDRDDMASDVLMKTVKKCLGYGPEKVLGMIHITFTAMCRTMLSREIIDYLRAHRKPVPHYFDPRSYKKQWQLSVPKAVDVKMIMDELPKQLLGHIMRHNRFAFSKSAIRAVLSYLLSDTIVPHEMLETWFGVKQPAQLISFVVLMSRWFLWKYRDKFGNVLDGRIRDTLEFTGMRVRTLI